MFSARSRRNASAWATHPTLVQQRRYDSLVFWPSFHCEGGVCSYGPHASPRTLFRPRPVAASIPEWPEQSTLAPVQESPKAVCSSSPKLALGHDLLMLANSSSPSKIPAKTIGN